MHGEQVRASSTPGVVKHGGLLIALELETMMSSTFKDFKMDNDDFDFDGHEYSPDDSPPDFNGDGEEQPNEFDFDEVLEEVFQTGDPEENYAQALDAAHNIIDRLEPISEM